MAAAGLIVVPACSGSPPADERKYFFDLTEAERRVADLALHKYIESIVWEDISATARVLSLEADWLMARTHEGETGKPEDFLREFTDVRDRWGNRISRDWLAKGAVLVVRSSGADGEMDTDDDLIAVRWRRRR
jgi:hypothetical protein